ncbi:MAG: hypothetical protein OEL77_02810 [Nitrosopumilus sp.]|nr:hypothetical protein [Nitrosopumilus sp.]MDH3384926.1 hypothetical protein [Nitrosopumilus sp.]
MTFNNTQKLLAGALAFALVAGLTSPAFAQTPGLAIDTASGLNYDPLTASVALDFDSPADMVCYFQDEDCELGDETELEFDCGTGSCWMTVEDCCLTGDFYEVFDGGVSLGTTPEVEIGGDQISQGEFCFSAGPHVATIQNKVDDDTLYPAGLTVTLTQHEIDECPAPSVAGDLLSIDSSALVIGGLASSAVWIIPAVAGIAGAGMYLVKLRTNRD